MVVGSIGDGNGKRDWLARPEAIHNIRASGLIVCASATHSEEAKAIMSQCRPCSVNPKHLTFRHRAETWQVELLATGEIHGWPI